MPGLVKSVQMVAVNVPGATNIFCGDAANADVIKHNMAKRKDNFMACNCLQLK
jgi:hypothetical protein